MTTYLPQLCFLAVFLVACNSNQPSSAVEITDENLDLTSRNNNEVDIKQAWTYQLEYNNLVSKNEDLQALVSQQALEGEMSSGFTIYMTFEEDILVEHPKTFEQKRNHAILHKRGILTNGFKVNFKPFTGTLIGQKPNGEKCLVAIYESGHLLGEPKIWSDIGRLHRSLAPLGEEDKPKEEIHEIDMLKTRKPIIYLYPERDTTVTVQLDYQGQLTTTYPKCQASEGWRVYAEKDGTLTDPQTGQTYYGLYWEGIDKQPYDLSTGFVVQRDSLASFLDKKLAYLGLTRREANEFIIYWLPELERHPYALIHFAQDAYTDRAKLNIQPSPETLIRVFMVYQPLNQAINITPQKLSKVERKGFTVVEWGGRQAAKEDWL